MANFFYAKLQNYFFVSFFIDKMAKNTYNFYG